MGIVINQSIKNTIITYIGFAIGAVNSLYMYPHFLGEEFYGLTGYLLSDGTDLSNVFMNINKGASLSLANKFTSTNTFKGNIDLSGSFLYGRNDGYNFREVISAPFPIGYIIDNSNIFVTKDISCSSLIDVGTWIANCSA